MDKRFLRFETFGLACLICALIFPLLAFVHGSFDMRTWPESGIAKLVALVPLAITSSFVLTLIRRRRAGIGGIGNGLRFVEIEAIGIGCVMYALVLPVLSLTYGSIHATDWPLHERTMLVIMMPVVATSSFVLAILRRNPKSPIIPF